MTEQLIENTEAPPAPTKRARKPRKAKAPVAPKATRAPRQTLAAWLRGRGPNHPEAARLLGARVRGDLRFALKTQGELVAARKRVDAARAALEKASLEEASLAGYDPLPVFARLDKLAASITEGRDDTLVHGQDEDDATATADIPLRD